MDIIWTLNLWTEFRRDSAQRTGSVDEQLAPMTSLRNFGQSAPWRSYPASQQGKRIDFSCQLLASICPEPQVANFRAGCHQDSLDSVSIFLLSKKSLTRGRRSCEEKTFATSDVLVESLWPAPVPLPKITGEILWHGSLHLALWLQLPVILALILEEWQPSVFSKILHYVWWLSCTLP